MAVPKEDRWSVRLAHRDVGRYRMTVIIDDTGRKPIWFWSVYEMKSGADRYVDGGEARDEKEAKLKATRALAKETR